MSRDTLKRSIVKTIVFKAITTSVTAIFTGIKGAILIHAILTLVYLLYELVWNRISWGKQISK